MTAPVIVVGVDGSGDPAAELLRAAADRVLLRADRLVLVVPRATS